MSMIDSKRDLVQAELKALKRAFLVGIYPAGQEKKRCEESLEELRRLSDTFGLEVVGCMAVPMRRFDPATMIGKGKMEELFQEAEALFAEVIIFDEEISPRQQRNLDRFFKRPVIDRTELIIEVFAKRAQTKEARLQVELAKCRYQLPRLKRMWTHLSRQAAVSGRGGAYLKGAGEKQLEIDKRLTKKRMDLLQKAIEKVTEQRKTVRRARLRSAIPALAIVGYTNAGKSTLLKALTQAEVLIEDKLFATLDTTTRKFTLPNRQQILLVDTVGFIRKIPTTLVAAFKSTLEEALYTDILLHLVDVSHPLAEEQAEETERILKELGVKEKPVITVLNKIDACRDPLIVQRFRIRYPRCVAVSALYKQGMDVLLEQIVALLKQLRVTLRLRIPQSHYRLVSELFRFGKVAHVEYVENDVFLEIELPKEFEERVLPFVTSR